MDFRNLSSNEINLKELAPTIIIFLGFALLAILGLNSFYTVNANEQAVVLRFGRYQTTAMPGLHFKIPLVHQVLKVSIEEHSLRLPGGIGAQRQLSLSEEETLMLTGDLNAASVEWTVQWKITTPKDYLFSFHHQGDPAYLENVIATAAKTVMNRLVGDYSIDEVLTEKRAEIALDARKSTQLILDQYQCGISITDLQMQRVTPPAKVKPAFDAVNSAIQNSTKLENEANKERNTLLPAAQAARDKKIQDAKGYADRRRLEAAGEIAALRAKYEAYQKAPEVTRVRLYLEAMEEILKGIEHKVIIDSELNHILPLLQLEQGSRR